MHGLTGSGTTFYGVFNGFSIGLRESHSPIRFS